MNQHHLVMKPVRYPGGLRIMECQSCAYALAAEVDEYGIIQLETAVSLNHGEPTATHGFFQTPKEPLTLDFSASDDEV